MFEIVQKYRRNRRGAPDDPEAVELIRKLYAMGLSQTEIAEQMATGQSRISFLMKKHSIKARKNSHKLVLLNSNQQGSKNRTWTGEAVGYAGAHSRVNRERGRPRKCETCGTEDSKIYDWANMSGRYHDVNDYKRMCRSCHFKHDGVAKNFRKGGVK